MTKPTMQEFRKIPLGLPLSAAAIGTVATLWYGKNLHAGFGIAWLALSLLHGVQHAGKMKLDMEKAFTSDAPEKAPVLTLKDFLKQTEIASFIPGRLRVYNLCLAGNAKLAEQVKDYVTSFTGVTSAAVSPVTGSILINYDPKTLRKVPGLARLEAAIADKF